jgi:hypothetical protein
MQLGCVVDGEGERLRHRHAIVVLGRRMFRIIKIAHGRGGEAAAVFGERNVEPLAIGRRLLVRERQAAERLRQESRVGALAFAARAGDKVVGAGLLGPDPYFDRRDYLALTPKSFAASRSDARTPLTN